MHLNVKLSREEHDDLLKGKRVGDSWARYFNRLMWFAAVTVRKPRKIWSREWGYGTSIKEDRPIEKPCHSCGYCPYGQLVEAFPLDHGEYSCTLFGHDCPAFYAAEPLAE